MSVPDTVVRVEGVFKKFRRGELHDSLRDFVPALVRRATGGRRPDALETREFWAVQDVSFDVHRGEAFGIVGANGAGKSTILKLLSRIMPPTRGSVTIQGRLSALIEVSAGFHPDLTGRENVMLNGAILGLSRAEIRERFDAIVEFSGLEEFIDTPVKRYSSGMFARLGFSVAAHVQPDLLIVDEVLSVGDYLFQQKCVDRMNEIIASGATVIFVSHNLRAVTTLCSRSLLLERGRVLEIGRSADVVQSYLNRGQAGRTPSAEVGIHITSVAVQRDGTPHVAFESGEFAEIVVEATAREAHDDMSVVVAVVDQDQYLVFDTCTQRLGHGPLALAGGQSLRCIFRIRLRLAQGTYRVHAYLHRYVTNTAFDSWMSAATFFVSGTPAMRGVANLEPMLVAAEAFERSEAESPETGQSAGGREAGSAAG